MSGLVDGFGRVHRDLRISLTDKCSLRCTYCMPAEGVPWIPKQSVLTPDEIERVVRVAAGEGIETVRLTGGEPLISPNLVEIVRRLAAIEGPKGPIEVAMTTNGIRLPEFIPGLEEAGLSRLNISIDTLDPDRFLELTRRDRLIDVLAGIESARRSSLRPLKLNAVVMRGINEDEVADLVEFAIEHEAQMRFIEHMPLDIGHTWDRGEMVPREEILDSLSKKFSLEPLPGRGGAPAEVFSIDGGPYTVGVIASVTAPFCANCDRLRLTADGQLRNCLFAREELDLRTALRNDASDEGIRDIMRASVAAKRAGHGIGSPDFVQPERGMNAIGG
ncbi:MAG: GTP 3',8-cyclase MoaA [Solirubrobacterales bacterium]|nr:GTP 3',8-cyclase MoaA [Solirubrobacterales bacterium]OJU93565.1 MAG: cyclic pyranopterin phosphate synthase [Solirubrobacterales bacterium 67-14]